jgi:mono/diheme cytochrome c family protein
MGWLANHKGRFNILAFGGLWIWFLGSACWAVTDEERAKANALTERVSAAGKLFAEGAFVQSAADITAVQQDLIELLKSREPALQRLLKPLYARLTRAHGLLELEGATLPPLPTWEELTSSPPEMPAGDAAKPISFKADIAPWLISACGQCHINQQRGQFSLATYAALLQGPQGAAVLFAGSSRGSRLVDVIETGDMPRGGGQVTQEQLTTLKKWIDEGAKFDGPNPAAPLTSYASPATAPSSAPAISTPVTMATGSETVSFAKTIAPILLANCQGCHIDSQQASGGLRMDTFAQFLRGGGSGPVIVPAKVLESLLVQKIKGEAGDRMPAGGRPALKPDEIAAIETWIREGATFDGPSPEMVIDNVVAQVWAASANHGELMERRKQLALERWTKVIPNDSPATSQNDDIFVLGNVPSTRVEKILQQFSQATLQAKKLLKAPADQPLLKGGLTVFVLKSRYDYSEFGRMTERRELPKDWLGHWYADPLDAYGVLAADAASSDPRPSDKQAEALALQIVTGAYVGSFAQVPTWFSEGVARSLVRQSFRRGDDRVQHWQQAYPAAIQKVDKPETLLAGRLDEESAGLVGMGLTSFLMERANRRRFDQLLELLRSGQKFDAACAATFAAPDVMVKSWLGERK